MSNPRHIFARAPKDERITAQLGPIYKVAFYIMAYGILFDLFTRYNYLAQGSGQGQALFRDPIESATLIIACVFVGVAMLRRGIYTDSIACAEATSFPLGEHLRSSLALAALASVAAVGGRLYNEVLLFGWGGVTWAGDLAMLVFMVVMITVFALALQYLYWRAYRSKLDRLAEDDEAR